MTNLVSGWNRATLPTSSPGGCRPATKVIDVSVSSVLMLLYLLAPITPYFSVLVSSLNSVCTIFFWCCPPFQIQQVHTVNNTQYIIFHQEQTHQVYSLSNVQNLTTARWRCSHIQKEDQNAPILLYENC